MSNLQTVPADVAKSLQEAAWAQYQETTAALKKQGLQSQAERKKGNPYQ